MERFKMVAGKMSYPSNVKSGRFYWQKEWTVTSL
jgi:hypothetical protein